MDICIWSNDYIILLLEIVLCRKNYSYKQKKNEQSIKKTWYDELVFLLNKYFESPANTDLPSSTQFITNTYSWEKKEKHWTENQSLTIKSDKIP